MHIPDGYLSPSTCATLYVASAPFWYIALQRVRRLLNTRLVPLLAVFSAFSFVIMMFNLPLPGGTTGHAVGMGIATIVLGPWGSMLAVSVALLASYFVLVLLQVFFRYVLNESLFWAEELVRAAMLWGIMLSSALVAASRGHIRVEVLELMLPPRGRRVVMWMANVMTLAFSLILLYAGIQFIARTWMQQSPVLDVPKWTVYLAIPIGAALESLLMILTWNRDVPVDELTDRTL